MTGHWRRHLWLLRCLSDPDRCLPAQGDSFSETTVLFPSCEVAAVQCQKNKRGSVEESGDGIVRLGHLTGFPHDFMGDAGDQEPCMPNGLQGSVRDEVQILDTGVSASLRLFEQEAAPGPARALRQCRERGTILNGRGS
jgi:hypothetical protein